MEGKKYVAIEEKGGRRCYAYFIAISGHLWSLIAKEWWGTSNKMISNAYSMSATVKIFRRSAGIAVYELRHDDCFHFVHGCDLYDTYALPVSFSRCDFPSVRRQNVK